jgi:Site-specific DNA methylase
VLVFHIDAKTVLGGDKPHVLGPVAFMADDYKNGTFEQCDTARPLTTSADRTRAAPILAFSCKDYGADAAIELAPTMRAMGHSGSHANAGGQLAVCVTGDITHTLKAEGFDASEDGTGRGQPIVAHAIQAGALRENPAGGPDGMGVQADVAYTLEARSEVQCAQMGMAVRRLTPKECARLQGFPDNHLSQVMVRGKPAADGPMYKAFGNSWAIPCVFWIGARIDKALRGLK